MLTARAGARPLMDTEAVFAFPPDFTPQEIPTIPNVFEQALPARLRLSPDGRFIAYVARGPAAASDRPSAGGTELGLWIRERGGEARRWPVVSISGVRTLMAARGASRVAS